MKLVIQIPCKDEAQSLKETLASLPRSIEGVDEIERLVVDDGSVDGTTAAALALGVEHVLRFESNRGLAKTFSTALRFSRCLAADIVVNTDGDNQYRGEDVERVVRLVLQSKADMVIGARDFASIAHCSPLKRWLQRRGSQVIGLLAGYPVLDATSGFRAFSRKAVSMLKVLSIYTYTIETIVQAKAKNIRVEFVTIRTNDKLRESRLMRSIGHYLFETARSIIVILLLYRPIWVGLIGLASGLAILALSLLLQGFAPFWFAVVFLTGIMTIGSSVAFALLAQILFAQRVHFDESFSFLEGGIPQEECARLLGASEYHCKGTRVF